MVYSQQPKYPPKNIKIEVLSPSKNNIIRFMCMNACMGRYRALYSIPGGVKSIGGGVRAVLIDLLCVASSG